MDEAREEPDGEMVHENGSAVVRWALISLGTASVIAGVVGLFLPLIPTTPFLLLAAACYARSSKRFYDWLLSNKWFGPLIRDWRDGKGIPLKSKVIAIGTLTITLGTSIVFFVPYLWLQLTLGALGVAIATYLASVPTKR